MWSLIVHRSIIVIVINSLVVELDKVASLLLHLLMTPIVVIKTAWARVWRWSFKNSFWLFDFGIDLIEFVLNIDIRIFEVNWFIGFCEFLLISFLGVASWIFEDWNNIFLRALIYHLSIRTVVSILHLLPFGRLTTLLIGHPLQRCVWVWKPLIALLGVEHFVLCIIYLIFWVNVWRFEWFVTGCFSQVTVGIFCKSLIKKGLCFHLDIGIFAAKSRFLFQRIVWIKWFSESLGWSISILYRFL